MRSKKAGKVHEKKGILTRMERVKLMAATRCDERTIRRWERGEPVREATRDRLTEAAKKIGAPVPEAAA